MLVNNYNFGVYNPPSGLETVINSYQASTVLALKSNNLQARKEKGIQQSFGIPLFKLVDIDINLINYLNDNNLKVFTGMILQGWGGNSGI